MIYDSEKRALNEYAEKVFGHSDIPYRSIVVSLLHNADISVESEISE
ncbi:hypothetical protein NDI76_11510 [Halogeometricum sp. S1BR25-6]|uniref:Uncharacterized protein n=1 Tax=Halogeometricum salsisoli TaxID=2950536 RepID=A0ABU2GF15_9EURY|nr:hypothetical protein [Halogeometricum sp. S1BR25-6]MDS0299369.1 hypothetical protein [Halogeometricum sp. S1BR25-6]